MLDEQSVQLSRRVVAHLDRADVQDFTGLLESGKSRTKHGADFARSRLAIEMDQLFARCDWRVHDVLSPALSKTNRRRTDHADCPKAKRNEASASCRSAH